MALLPISRTFRVKDVESQILAEIHPDIVVGERDYFVFREFDFPLKELEQRYGEDALLSWSQSAPGVSGLKSLLTEAELGAVRSVIIEIQSKRGPDKKRGYDVISVVRFSCGSYDVRPVNW